MISRGFLHFDVCTEKSHENACSPRYYFPHLKRCQAGFALGKLSPQNQQLETGF